MSSAAQRRAGLVPGLPPAGRAAVRAGVVGNYVDQINIFLPVVALAPALATLAGPHAGVTAGAVVTVATLLGRPIGAMLFGRIADRVGRTRTTQLAIGGTAACSLAIAAVPTHESIGVAAITAVVVLRFVGGAFLAGEYTSAIPLAMEWSVPRRRGLVSGLIMSMAPWAQSTIAFTTLGLLTVLGPQAYAAWREKQVGPAAVVASPQAPLALIDQGRAVFGASGCAACHTIRGTEANGLAGPDLTHVGSRQTLGAGILPNNQGTMAGWIADSQGIKPGNRMPSYPVLTGQDLRAVAAYLESLK